MTVTKLNKSTADANTTITMLKASVLSHIEELKQMKEHVNQQIKQQVDDFAGLKDLVLSQAEELKHLRESSLSHTNDINELKQLKEQVD